MSNKAGETITTNGMIEGGQEFEEFDPKVPEKEPEMTEEEKLEMEKRIQMNRMQQ